MGRTLLYALLLIGCGAELAGDGRGDDRDDGKGDGSGSGSGSGSGGGPEPAALTANDFIEQLGIVQCDRMFACKNEFPAAEVGAPFEVAVGNVPADCYADADEFYEKLDVVDGVDNGRILYTEVAAIECVGGIDLRASCTEFWQ